MQISQGFSSLPLSQSAPLPPKEGTSAPAAPAESFVPGEGEDFMKKFRRFVGNLGVMITGIPMYSVPIKSDKAGQEAMGNRYEAMVEALKPGDVILSTNNLYPLVQLGETVVGDPSGYTHAAIYEGGGVFIDATTGEDNQSGFGVDRKKLSDYMGPHILYQVIRPPYKSEESAEKALDYARSQIGKPYDEDFETWEDSSFYCTELVAKSLMNCGSGIEVPVTVAIGSDTFFPGNLQKIGGQVVYDDGATLGGNLLTHYPGVLGGLVTGAAAGMALGPVGAVGGLVAGTVATLCIGGYGQQQANLPEWKKMQTQTA